MLRLLVFLFGLAAATAGLSWLADQPGGLTATWGQRTYTATPLEAFGLALALAAAAVVAFWLLWLVLGAPGLIAEAMLGRRRERGMAALTRGLVAVGAGDLREAQRCAREAERHVGDEPLARLLRAQTAQASGDRATAVSAFNDMLAHDETLVLGLRGLHLEARRAGEGEAALTFARRAYERGAPPWAAQAVLDDFAQRGDWANALATVEAHSASLDKPTAMRWRAVLLTALAQSKAEADPARALAHAREALELAPTLVPAAAILGRLTAASGDLKKAARLLENAYRTSPHPNLAEVYVRLRPGDSSLDRLTRAKTLARVAPLAPDSMLVVARAALEAQDPAQARQTLAPLLDATGLRPTARVCLAMAEIEDSAGDAGAVREWLARAARAPRDKAWVADGVISDAWAPVGPRGALDAFVWRTPEERLTDLPPLELSPAPPPPASPALPASPPRVAPSPPRPAPRAVSLMPASAPDDPGPERRKAGEFRDAIMD
jgi:HemY protein